MQTFETLTFVIQYNGEDKKITAKPHASPLENNFPISFQIAVNDFPKGKIKHNGSKWESNDISDQRLIKVIGDFIDSNKEQVRTKK